MAIEADTESKALPAVPNSLLTKASLALESRFKPPEGSWRLAFWAAFALICVSCAVLLVIALFRSHG